jgi:hypothetical protein
MEFISVLGGLLAVSLCANIALVLGFRRERATLKATFALELEKARKAPAPTFAAEDLLNQLTRQGQAVVRIECLNPSDLFLRSPRS